MGGCNVSDDSVDRGGRPRIHPLASRRIGCVASDRLIDAFDRRARQEGIYNRSEALLMLMRRYADTYDS